MHLRGVIFAIPMRLGVAIACAMPTGLQCFAMVADCNCGSPHLTSLYQGLLDLLPLQLLLPGLRRGSLLPSFDAMLRLCVCVVALRSAHCQNVFKAMYRSYPFQVSRVEHVRKTCVEVI